MATLEASQTYKHTKMTFIKAIAFRMCLLALVAGAPAMAGAKTGLLLAEEKQFEPGAFVEREGTCEPGATGTPGKRVRVEEITDGTSAAQRTGHHRNCRWTVSSSSTSAADQDVKLKFTRFHTESKYDYVYIYTGKCESTGRQVAKLDGHKTRSRLRALTYEHDGPMCIKFTSDRSVGKTGFSLRVSSIKKKKPICKQMTVSDQSGSLVSAMESVCRKMEADDDLEEGDRMGECDETGTNHTSANRIPTAEYVHDKNAGASTSTASATGTTVRFRSSLSGAFDDQRRRCAESWKKKKVCDRACTLILLGPSDTLEGCTQFKAHCETTCQVGSGLAGFGKNCDRGKVLNQCGGEYCEHDLNCQSNRCDTEDNMCQHCGPDDAYCLNVGMGNRTLGLNRLSALKLWTNTWKHKLQGRLGRDTFRDSEFFKMFQDNWMDRYQLPTSWKKLHERFEKPESYVRNTGRFITRVVGGDGWIQLGGDGIVGKGDPD
eukprot:g5895.t1